MDAFVWWLAQFIIERTAVRLAKKLTPPLLGRLLGKRYRSLREDFATLKYESGRGDAATRLIQQAPDFRKSVRIFTNWRYAERVVEAERVYAALTARMQQEGPTADVLEFLADEGANIDEMPKDDEYERLRAFEWMIIEFIEKTKYAHDEA